VFRRVHRQSLADDNGAMHVGVRMLVSNKTHPT
jgi:hypothetical protein